MRSGRWHRSCSLYLCFRKQGVHRSFIFKILRDQIWDTHEGRKWRPTTKSGRKAEWRLVTRTELEQALLPPSKEDLQRNQNIKSIFSNHRRKPRCYRQCPQLIAEVERKSGIKENWKISFEIQDQKLLFQNWRWLKIWPTDKFEASWIGFFTSPCLCAAIEKEGMKKLDYRFLKKHRRKLANLPIITEKEKGKKRYQSDEKRLSQRRSEQTRCGESKFKRTMSMICGYLRTLFYKILTQYKV